MPSLRSANQWSRPEPGGPRVFLSFHRQHLERATNLIRILEKSGISIISYDPDNRWPDGPMHILQQIVTECHAIVYVTPWYYWSRRKFVRFEHRIGKEFHISVIRVWSLSQTEKIVNNIRDESTKVHRKDLFWGLTVKRRVDNVCEVLTERDLTKSEINGTALTGLNIGHLGRGFMHDYGKAMRSGMKILWTLATLTIIAVSGALWWFLD